jgi:large subunit ribosomal protein L9
MIEVILREDVRTLGRAGEMVRVKPGYARNYLLPKGLAFEATEGNKKRIAAERPHIFPQNHFNHRCTLRWWA